VIFIDFDSYRNLNFCYYVDQCMDSDPHEMSLDPKYCLYCLRIEFIFAGNPIKCKLEAGLSHITPCVVR
jgi:hypothetical protein